MKHAKWAKIAGVMLVGIVSAALIFAADTPAMQEQRAKERQAKKQWTKADARKLRKDGNWKEAWKLYSERAKNPAADPKTVGEDMYQAIYCLGRLARQSEIDAFREEVIKIHAKNWRLLWRAAKTYLDGEHYGYIIAGEFHRGRHRGGGKYVSSYERDRVRALQLMQQSSDLIGTTGEKDASIVGNFYVDFAQMLMGRRGYREAWRLQYKVDLSKLPDYDESGRGRWGRSSGSLGAPVDEKGNPVYHKLPGSWKKATSDGERWRWCLMQAVEHVPARENEIRFVFAQFLHNQFGCHTMSSYGRFFGRTVETDKKKDTSGTWELHTLAENETIAKLASGVKRFKLPSEFNFIRIYQKAAKERGNYPRQSMDTLCQIFENRRQYPKAADNWRKNIERFGAGGNNWKGKRLEQIIGNWGQFEPIMTQPAQEGATVEFRFRNAQNVSFEAYEVKVEQLLQDVKAHIKRVEGVRNRLDWKHIRIENIGHRLVYENQSKYIGKRVASWDLDLKPRKNHFDKRITIATPLQKAGAYLLIAKLKDGNTSRIILWVADTAIVQKNLDKKNWYFVADAITGKPLKKVNVEFFGYRSKWVKRQTYDITTRNFSEFTDADGQIFLDQARQPRNYTWVVIARTEAGRLAYLGWKGVWYGNYYDAQYNRTKVFVMTDRPVYRPKQKVNFKFWINTAKYDAEGKSQFAGQTFPVEIRNPKNEKVLSKWFKVDEFGGADGTLELKKDATLGVYQIRILQGTNQMGGGHFRVEEYKKPEFEVTVEAPKEPIALGEKISAKIQAKYYFGAPVVDAMVKYKVLRTEYSGTWYPWDQWNWLYGEGYWWFGYDYSWYPGWRHWGCKRPTPFWWSWRPTPQPEVVAENEVEIGKDGIVKIEIDTSLAKAIHGDRDHKYSITAEVTDKSRRTIVGVGNILVSREPFKVYTWIGRGHYRVGDVIGANCQARRLDGKGVEGTGVLRLCKITYRKGKPVETEVAGWKLNTDEEGSAQQQLKASEAGQYRLIYKLTDAKKHTIEGGHVFVVWGRGNDGSDFRFNNVELTPDKRSYKPGEKVKLRINTNRRNSTVLLFVRPSNGVYLPPKILRMKGKSVQEEIEVVKRDMPNFFVEAVTISDGRVYQEVRQLAVPPEKRVLDVKITTTKKEFKPGEKAKVKIQLVQANGEPFEGSTVVTIYDKAVEYISGGTNVANIQEFFWKWKRRHRPNQQSSLSKGSSNLLKRDETGISWLGVFGHSVADDMTDLGEDKTGAEPHEGQVMKNSAKSGRRKGRGLGAPGAAPKRAQFALETAASGMDRNGAREEKAKGGDGGGAGGPALVEPTVRKKFADTAFWTAALKTNKQGFAEVEFDMPENLSTWKTRVWAMGYGTRVGEGAIELITTKDLVIRLQAPRFFTQKDEVVLSANVHNYLKTAKRVNVTLEIEGGTLELLPGVNATQTVKIKANGEKRIDWRVKVTEPGKATVRMKALTDEESDAMQMSFPVYVHGMLKTESFSGALRPKDKSGKIKIRVPAERRPDESRLEVRYSPTLAMAMIDALPYTVEYPYGCTEQTLNRFLPTVITQKVLMRMGLDLEDIRKKRTNLNAQEIGDDVKRAHDWKRLIGKKRWDGKAWVPRNPVFDAEEVDRMVKDGVEALQEMQLGDGGWGWFSGWGERSYPHTTAVVVHGLQLARENDVAIVPGTLDRGVKWLKRYQDRELKKLINFEQKRKRTRQKQFTDNLDALVYMVLVDAKQDNKEMRKRLYRDRTHLAVYAKATFGIALHKVGDVEKRDMLIRNVDQFLVEDDENQTAYLKLPGGNWWRWYGSEIEANAFYLKLLALTEPKGRKASRLVKYLLNNRRHATYWSSTRDTAYCIEAFADFLKASGEDKPDVTIKVFMDGKLVQTVKVNKDNLFSFNNKFVLVGKQVTTGAHTIELKKTGDGPLYYNAYLTNFTLEDPITHAGLEIKVRRKYYKLTRVDKTIKAEGSRGQAVDQKVEKYERKELANLATLKSGDLVEIELTIESKNDYEYIMFEDMKAAGFEPVDVRSGYTSNGMGAYMELRDERVTFFVRRLARGKHSIAYRMRAEIPGTFAALPTKVSAMYAPELKANSDEIKLNIVD